MKDISKKKRTMIVWLDKQVTGRDPTYEIVKVPAGEDAHEICMSVLDEMIGNELDTGYQEATEGEIRKYGSEEQVAALEKKLAKKSAKRK